MAFKTHIKEIDEAGFITFTKNELKELLEEQYERGYNDGVYAYPPTDITETKRPPIIKLIHDDEFIN